MGVLLQSKLELAVRVGLVGVQVGGIGNGLDLVLERIEPVKA